MITNGYKPHKGQKEIHNDTHRYKVIVCGRRWGKTMSAINHLIREAGAKMNGQYWYLCPTYKQAKLIAWEMLKKYAVPQIRLKVNESDLSIQLRSGSIIRLIGADNPENLRGVGLDGCIFDEYADIKREVWQTIVRPMLTVSKGWAWFMGTPKGKLNQLYEQFIKDEQFQDRDYLNIDGQEVGVDSDYKSFKFLTTDNPYIDITEVEKARQELSPQYFRQEYEAGFETYTGIVYKEYEDRHNIEIKTENWWRQYVGIDTGRHTAISFVAIDKNDIAYVFDEIYDYDGIVADIAQKILAKCAYYKIKPTFIIDSASQVKREYEKAKIAVLDSEKDLENSINIIRNRFKSDKLFFDKDKCRMHIVEHKGYIWSDKLVGVNRRPIPVKEADHTCSAIQYILNWPAVRKVQESPEDIKFKQSLAYATIRRDNNKNWKSLG